ncbi:hypothetical protein ACYPKM_00560 [Pseudomonas aeruginosa]
MKLLLKLLKCVIAVVCIMFTFVMFLVLFGMWEPLVLSLVMLQNAWHDKPLLEGLNEALDCNSNAAQ